MPMADPISKALILLSIVASLLLCSHASSSSDVPFIVAHKKASLNRLKSGAERVSVSIDIYNQGSSTAYDISLADDTWPSDLFSIISGSTSKSWERLDAGGILSHTFELEAKTKGVFSGQPAVIKFRIPTKSALQEAFSTPILPLDILADRPPEKKLEWAKRLLAKYGSLFSVISIMVLFVYLVATPSKSGAKGSKKKR
uniref:Translocon-associated protein subunit beta n=1 Tax=Lotus japonicus TaxID=34305 RepID=I3SDS8_LOTJA|nr:unknown [Lotus japonicus]